jgi:hypothetical protein
MSQSWIDAPLRKVLNSYCKQQSETQKKVMKTVNRWLLNVALAIVVAGSVAQAKAAMCFTEESFLPKMVPGSFWTNTSPQFVGGQTYTDPGSATDYGYTVKTAKGNIMLQFIADPNLGLPTGVGGFFPEGTALTFAFIGSSGLLTTANYTVTSTGFFGYTTDVNPDVLAIKTLTFSTSASTPSKLYVGLDVVVPEPSTIIAGCLLLLPFAASTLRRVRRSR